MPSTLPTECPWCRTAFSEPDHDGPRGVITCSGCGALTRAPAKAPRPALAPLETLETPAVARFEPEPIARPPLFTVEEEGKRLLVSWPHDYSRGVFALVGLPFVIGAIWFEVLLPTPSLQNFGVAFALSALPLGLMWDPLILTFNRMRLEVTGGGFKLSSGPVPNPHGKAFIARAEVTQLYPFKYYRRKEKITLYGVRAIYRDGTRGDLVTALRSPEEALWLEQAIEQKLDLRDQYVEGQVQRLGQSLTAAPDDAVALPAELAEVVTEPGLNSVTRKGEVDLAETASETRLSWKPRGTALPMWSFFFVASIVLSALAGSILSNAEVVPLAWKAVAAGVALSTVVSAWRMAGALFNRRFVKLTADALSLGETPLPALGNFFRREKVRQLYVSRTWPDDSSSSKPTFGVKVILDDGTHAELATGCPGFTEARFIEQKLERALGLRDVRVREEFRGT
jgi:hypothetical protein